MNVLIIGSNSTIGQRLGNRLSKTHHVSFAGRSGPDIYIDLAGADFDLIQTKQYEVVIHVASDFGGDSIADIKRATNVNSGGILKTCELAKVCGAKQLIYLSSHSASYGPGNPYYNSYALTKRHSEELAQMACQTWDINLLILRPTQVYDIEEKCRSHQEMFYFILDHVIHTLKIILIYIYDPFKRH